MGGRINQVLSNAFSALVTDGATPAPAILSLGLSSRFERAVAADAGGYLVFNEGSGDNIEAGTSGDGNAGFLVSSNNRRMF